MNIFKMIFGKFFAFILLLVVQIALLVVFLAVLRQYFPLFQVLSDIVGLVVFFVVINKKENPEYKLPWLFLILVFPIFGVTFYLLFANRKLKKKDVKHLTLVTDKIAPFVRATQNEKNEIKEFLGDNAGIENFLTQSAFMDGSLGGDVKYYPVGEDFWKDLLIELKKAEKFIFMEYYIIGTGKMWTEISKILEEKVKDGVEVRVLCDDFGCNGKLGRKEKRRLKELGIQLAVFNPFVPIVSSAHNNRDHRKITVIDGKVGFTGGINIADEYINETHPFGHWKDTAIKIEGEAIKNLTAMFLINFDTATKNVSDYQKYFDVEQKVFENGGYIHPFGAGPKPYYKEPVAEGNYINMINSAKKYVFISTPYLILDYNMSMALKSAALRGVDVKVLIPHIPDKKLVLNMSRSNASFLLESGVKIFEYTPGFNHAKMCVCDDNLAFVGTINLDYRSLTHNFECGAVLYKSPAIQDIKKDFEDTLSQSQQITKENFKLSKFARFMNSIVQLFSTLF